MNSTNTWFYVGCFNGKSLKKYIASVNQLRDCDWINEKKFSYTENSGVYWEGIILHEADTVKKLKEDVYKYNPRCPHNAFNPFPSKNNNLEEDIDKSGEVSNLMDKKASTEKAESDEEQVEYQNSNESDEEISNMDNDLYPVKQILEEIDEDTSKKKRKVSLRIKKTTFNYNEFDYDNDSNMSYEETSKNKHRMLENVVEQNQELGLTTENHSVTADAKIRINIDRMNELNKTKKKYRKMRSKYHELKLRFERKIAKIEQLRNQVPNSSGSLYKSLTSDKKKSIMSFQLRDMNKNRYCVGNSTIDNHFNFGHKTKERMVFRMKPRQLKNSVRNMACLTFGVDTLDNSTGPSYNAIGENNQTPLDIRKIDISNDTLNYLLEDQEFKKISLTEKKSYLHHLDGRINHLIADWEKKSEHYFQELAATME